MLGGMEVVRVLDFGSVKEEGEDPAVNRNEHGVKRHQRNNSNLLNRTKDTLNRSRRQDKWFSGQRLQPSSNDGSAMPTEQMSMLRV